jgi:hypothetical protein
VKRRVGLILLLLMAGAIVNVAVAWVACFCRVDSITTIEFVDDAAMRPFFEAGWQPAGHQMKGWAFLVSIERAWGAEWRAFTETGLPPTPRGGWSGSQAVQRVPAGACVQSGSPLPALGAVLVHGIYGGAVLVGDEHILPLRPIWPGFAINTLFYAGILLITFAAPFALRRWRRVKRGLCPACAYPTGASGFCSECGKPVRTK